MFKFLYVFMLIVSSASSAQRKVAFDQKLADSLHADQYGMKKYILVMLKSGTEKIDIESERDSIFKGHLNNIKKLAAEGKMIVAGPLGENEKSYEGIFILNVATREEAKELLQSDPAIKSKALATELFEWYGSAALPMYLPYHDRVQKTSF